MSNAATLSRAYIAARLAERAGDRRIVPRDLPPDATINPPGGLISAAVLVPLVEGPDGYDVVLTQRAAHLSKHAGQISFPGGRTEPEDPDPIATALREAQEEIALPCDAVEILGMLDSYVTGTGFLVVPVVGIISRPVRFVPDPFEVASILTPPLDFLTDPANRRRDHREVNGRRRFFHAIPWGEHYIWGATAGMLVNFAERLGRSAPLPTNEEAAP